MVIGRRSKSKGKSFLLLFFKKEDSCCLFRALARAAVMRLRWPALLATAVVVIGMAWGFGFAWFVHATSRLLTMPPPARADGIIVLTGGAGRVERALHLLAEGRARRLLISGVGRADFADLARRANVPFALAPFVTLGRVATSTRGNALEAADWVREFGIKTAIVVTSDYHMPRALVELAGTTQGVTLLPVAVMPPEESVGARLRLLAWEYTKLLAAEFGLSRVISREESAR